MSTVFSTFLLESGVTQVPRSNWSPRTDGKVKILNKQLSTFFRS